MCVASKLSQIINSTFNSIFFIFRQKKTLFFIVDMVGGWLVEMGLLHQTPHKVTTPKSTRPHSINLFKMSHLCLELTKKTSKEKKL